MGLYGCILEDDLTLYYSKLFPSGLLAVHFGIQSWFLAFQRGCEAEIWLTVPFYLGIVLYVLILVLRNSSVRFSFDHT